MKKLLIGSAAAAVIIGIMFPAHAQPRKVVLSVTTHSVTSSLNVAVTNAIAPGYIDEVYVDVPSGTGNVTLTAKEQSVTLVSKTAMAADTIIRPRVYPTDTDGTQVTTNGWERYNAYGENLIFAVTNANATNVIWKCWIKYDDGK